MKLKIYFVSGNTTRVNFTTEEVRNEIIDFIFNNNFNACSKYPVSGQIINWKLVEYVEIL